MGLIVLSPIFIVSAFAVRLSSKGPIFFTQERVGKDFRRFRIVKFRTMIADARMPGPKITGRGDKRITSVGRVLRLTKIDELPQLFNVLRGDMSFVGPRPEIPQYVEQFKGDFREILKVRPGITDPTSIVYRDEEELLVGVDPDRIYREEIMPRKIQMYKDYLKRKSFFYDLRLIFKTLSAVVRGWPLLPKGGRGQVSRASASPTAGRKGKP